MSVVVMASGLVALVLGVWHVGVPRWFDFAAAIGIDADGPRLRTLRIGTWRHPTTRRDVLGVAWVMNAGMSYVLISIGLFGLAAPMWIGSEGGRWLALWIAGWWGIRAALQLPMGRRQIDLLLVALFAGLAVVYGAAALA